MVCFSRLRQSVSPQRPQLLEHLEGSATDARIRLDSIYTAESTWESTGISCGETSNFTRFGRSQRDTIQDKNRLNSEARTHRQARSPFLSENTCYQTSRLPTGDQSHPSPA